MPSNCTCYFTFIFKIRPFVFPLLFYHLKTTLGDREIPVHENADKLENLAHVHLCQ